MKKLDVVEETSNEVESTLASKVCTNCNTANVADAVFCSGCGSKLLRRY